MVVIPVKDQRKIVKRVEQLTEEFTKKIGSVVYSSITYNPYTLSDSNYPNKLRCQVWISSVTKTNSHISVKANNIEKLLQLLDKPFNELLIVEDSTNEELKQ